MGANKQLTPIRPDELYALEAFIPAVGQGVASIREARRRGLKVQYVHGRAYVLGRDWIEYVEAEGRPTKNAKETEA